MARADFKSWSDRLRDREQAIENRGFVLPNGRFLRKRPSDFPPGTIGYLADQAGIAPDAFVNGFAQAGIQGLTPDHFVQQSHIDALVSYARAAEKNKAQEAYRDESLVESKIIVVQEVDERLMRQLASVPKLMHSLAPRRFEELVARLLEDQGCEVTLTKRTRDGGYDIFGRMKAGPTKLVFLAECKRYAPEKKVGVEVVRGLYGVTEMHRANLGIVVTTSSFTKDAYEEKVRIGPRMDLKDFADLRVWLAPYANAG